MMASQTSRPFSSCCRTQSMFLVIAIKHPEEGDLVAILLGG
jgi:hypothetical protein